MQVRKIPCRLGNLGTIEKFENEKPGSLAQVPILPGYYLCRIKIRVRVYISFPIGKWRKRPAAGPALSR